MNVSKVYLPAIPKKLNSRLCVFHFYFKGHETKAMLNNRGPRYKRSKIEQRMNVDIFFCVGLLFIMCLIGAIGIDVMGNFIFHFEKGKTIVAHIFLSSGLYIF